MLTHGSRCLLYDTQNCVLLRQLQDNPGPLPLMREKMLILGLDPGFANLGWAALLVHSDGDYDAPPTLSLLACGVLVTRGMKNRGRDWSSSRDEVRRIRGLYRGMADLTYPAHPSQDLNSAHIDSQRRRKKGRKVIPNFRPLVGDAAALYVEEMSWGMRSKITFRQLGYAWGAIVALSEERRLPLKQIPIKDLKREATGDGSASKEDVIEALLRRDNCKQVFRSSLASIPKTNHEHVADAVAVVYAGARIGDPRFGDLSGKA